MNKEKRSGWIRMLIGGALGLLGGFVWVPYVLYSREYPPLALLACVGLGVMAGVATQPFAESGRELLLRSAGHFAVTAAFFALLVMELDMASDWMGVLFWEGLLALLYLLIWLGRWIGWYVEVSQLRELLVRGKGREYLLPSVYGYILMNHLYGTQVHLKCLDLPELRACSYSMIRHKRVAHVMGVEEEAVKLAKFWGADPELARQADRPILIPPRRYFARLHQIPGPGGPVAFV